MLPSVFCELYLAHMNTFPSLSITKYHFRFISSGARKAEGRPSEASWIFFVTFSYFWSTFLILSVILGRNCFHTVLYSRASKRVKAEAVSEEAVAGSVAAASKANAPRAAASNNQGRSLSSFWWEQEEQFWQEEKEKKAWKKVFINTFKIDLHYRSHGAIFYSRWKDRKNGVK